MWWHTLVVPATQEAQAGESLESRRQTENAVSQDCATVLQPDRARLRLKKQQQKNQVRIMLLPCLKPSNSFPSQSKSPDT